MSNSEKPVNRQKTCSCISVGKLFGLRFLHSKAKAIKPLSNLTEMESLPEPIVQHILSNINNAKDVAVCKSVSKTWSDLMPYVNTLHFSRDLFAYGKCNADTAILQMISSIVRLEELIVECPFTVAGLVSWLSLSESSLRVLELRMNKNDPKNEVNAKLECIQVARNLESLKLSHMIMGSYPTWEVFHKLKNVEIVGAELGGNALSNALRACPHLTSLSLLACSKAFSISIDMPCLKYCKLDFKEDSCIILLAPNLEDLDVQGFGDIRISDTNFLRNLSIAQNSGRISQVGFRKLVALERLTISGVIWEWEAMCEMLLVASEVKHLFINVGFPDYCGRLFAIPDVDLVEFFNSHSKLQTLEIHGAMFATLCGKDSLKNVDSDFVIPNLEELVITVTSPLSEERTTSTVKCIANYSKNLKKVAIRDSSKRR